MRTYKVGDVVGFKREHMTYSIGVGDYGVITEIGADNFYYVERSQERRSLERRSLWFTPNKFYYVGELTTVREAEEIAEKEGVQEEIKVIINCCLQQLLKVLERKNYECKTTSN